MDRFIHACMHVCSCLYAWFSWDLCTPAIACLSTIPQSRGAPRAVVRELKGLRDRISILFDEGLVLDRNLFEKIVCPDETTDLGELLCSLSFRQTTNGGELSISIQSAIGLTAMDDGGTSDPYVIVKVGNEQKRTSVKPETLNPKWYEQFVFAVKSMETEVMLEVWDKDTCKRDDFMGELWLGTISHLHNCHAKALQSGVSLRRPIRPSSCVEVFLHAVYVYTLTRAHKHASVHVHTRTLQVAAISDTDCLSHLVRSPCIFPMQRYLWLYSVIVCRLNLGLAKYRLPRRNGSTMQRRHRAVCLCLKTLSIPPPSPLGGPNTACRCCAIVLNWA